MKKVDIVRKYVDDYPDMPNRTLAKLIVKQNPELYSSIENCRTALRGVKGQSCTYSVTHKQLPAENAIKNNVGNPYSQYSQSRKSPANVLVFDIETSPIVTYTWGLYNQNINTNQIVQDWFILSWSAKWLFSEQVMSDVLTTKEALNANDKRVVKSLHALFNQADILIAHNGAKFDIRKVQARFLQHGLKKPSPYQIIDTLLHARKQFSITSNRLDYLGQYLGLGRKIDTGGFELWRMCMAGDKNSLIKMNQYCNQDVLLLESVYLKMRPYITPHPNMGLYIEENIHSCPTCGSGNLKLNGTYYTTVNAYDALQCGDCGAWSRSRKTNTPLKDNERIKSSLPK